MVCEADHVSDHVPQKLKRKAYERELARLEIELVRMQYWVIATGARVAVVFEGRDAAGKGGTIKRIMNRLNPRAARVVALPAPTEREKTQLYLQRYIPHLPAAGEIVLFDRSWYNRLGVERVMGFATHDEYDRFLNLCPAFERLLVTDGILLIKYWLHISDDEQERRFRARIDDPRRRWKLSPMDVASWDKWVDYSRARDTMLRATDIDEAPWNVVNANIKRNARLNIIRHLLDAVPYEKMPPKVLDLPPRPPVADYVPPADIEYRWIPDEYG